MSVVPSLSSSPPPESYFAQLSTRWDVIKFLIPLLLLAGGGICNAYYTQQEQGQKLQAQAVQIQGFQDAKEARGERLIVVETKVQAVQDDVTVMKADIKELLKRIPSK